MPCAASVASGFSRDHRYTLGSRIEDGILEVLELLVEASYTSSKGELLGRANLRLDRVRFLVRMAKDLRLISLKQYEHAAASLNGIGQEIGGWARSQKTTAP